MRRILTFGFGLVLAFATAANAFAATADGKSPSTAAPLADIASTSLMGSGGGAFAYYTFNYPGDGSQATISLDFSPIDPATANAIGIDLWQNGQLVATTNGIG